MLFRSGEGFLDIVTRREIGHDGDEGDDNENDEGDEDEFSGFGIHGRGARPLATD